MASYEQLLAVGSLLSRAGIPYCLGGSGLLRALGLVDANNDWDIMTECSQAELLWVLDGRRYIDKPATDIFCSAYMLQMPDFGADIIGSFAIRVENRICRIPGVVSGWWHGVVPLASPEVWFVAYRLMGREDKALLLARYLREKGVDQAAAALVLREPLPDLVSREVREWCGWAR